jgi:hypothetical protein
VCSEVQKEKNAKLHQLRLDAEHGNTDLTFAPKISTTSVKLARAAATAASADIDDTSIPPEVVCMDVALRLNGHHTNANLERRIKKRAEAHAKAAEGLTFRPSLSANSRAIAQQSTKFKGDRADFVTRQLADGDDRRQTHTMTVLANEQQNNEIAPFHPTINQHTTDRVLSSSTLHRHHIHENEQERLERLAFGDGSHRQASRQRLIHEHYDDYTFVPVISDTSRRLAYAAEMAAAQRAAHGGISEPRHGEAAYTSTVAAVEREFASQHTFQPQLSSRSVAIAHEMVHRGDRISLQPNSDDLQHITDHVSTQRQLRESKRQAAQRAQQLAELQQCTFEPSISKSTPKQPTGPVVVRGLARFMERKQLARKLEAEQQERERQVFFVDVSAPIDRQGGAAWKDNNDRPLSSNGGRGRGSVRVISNNHTKPAPFKLSHLQQSSKVEAKRRSLHDRVRAEKASTFTFHPVTNVGSTRGVLKQMMNTTDSDHDTNYNDNNLSNDEPSSSSSSSTSSTSRSSQRRSQQHSSNHGRSSNNSNGKEQEREEKER